MTIIWCMVPETLSTSDRTFCHFGSFLALLSPKQLEKLKFWKNKKNMWSYYYFTQVYHLWQSYDLWFLRYEAWKTELFVILDYFLLWYPHNNPKNQNFKKLKKMTGDIIILHKCYKSHDHMPVLQMRVFRMPGDFFVQA